PDSFIFNRNIEYILSLDEGHDRPCWEWVKKGRTTRFPSRAWVPEMPSTILRDGLLMALTEGIKNEAAISAIKNRGAKRIGVIDLNHLPASETGYGYLKSFFEGYEIAVVAFPGSSLLNQVEHFAQHDLEISLFTQQNLGE
ncbi:MAG: hypothetical protein RI927_622, partial [Actinomycetota bacterium]